MADTLTNGSKSHITDNFKVMRQRRSVRKFKPDVPEREVLAGLVRHASLAPNAMNRQDWHFTFVLSAGVQKEIFLAVEEKWRQICLPDSGVNEAVKAYKRNFTAFRDAPVLVAVTTRKTPSFLVHILDGKAAGVMGSVASAYMAVQNLVLAAHAEGLGTCIFTGCNAAEEEILKILKMTPKRELVCLIALGYPDEEPTFPGRKSVEEIMTLVE